MTRKVLKLDGLSLDIPKVATFLDCGFDEIAVTPKAMQAVAKARRFVEEVLKGGQTYYGINTGFGKLASTRIADDKLDELQANLIRSHACGVDEPLDEPTVRLALLLRINSLIRGHSGVRKEVVNLYVAMLNKGVTPWVPARGSVGASGDLAPLAHVALVAMGEGRAFYMGKLMPTANAFAAAGLTPVQLKAKEGLALINGTQFIQAIGLRSIVEMRRLAKLADLACALSLEGLRGTDRAFDLRIAALRAHPGHATVASNLLSLLKGSQIRESHLEGDDRVQDAYSLRCVPQVHGACRDALQHVVEVFEREMNSVTDNPLLFPDDKDIISGGNFHGEPVAMPLDYLAIAASELASISERRIESLVNPDLSHLPPFLVGESGLNSGMMIAQVTAAALVSENKILAHPASVDSIPTSANKEDHVSMGVAAALKLRQIMKHLSFVLEIELLCGHFAVAYHRPLKAGKLVEQALEVIRASIPLWDKDRVLYEDFEKMRAVLATPEIAKVLAKLE